MSRGQYAKSTIHPRGQPAQVGIPSSARSHNLAAVRAPLVLRVSFQVNGAMFVGIC